MTTEIGGIRVPEATDGNNWSQHLQDLATDVSSTYAREGMAAAQRFLSKVNAGLEDAVIAVVGDSTGDGLVTTTDEWFPLLVDDIAAMFPTHTVVEYVWVVGSNSYGTPTTVQTGSGARTITVYNGSAAGKSTSYSLAFLDTMLPAEPDLLFVSHGHNEDDHTTAAKREMFYGRYLALTETITAKFPQASVCCVAQNPDLADDYQAERAEMIARIARMRGYGFINAHQAFVDTGEPASYIDGDGVHPNAAGGRLWADVVLPIFSGGAVNASTQPQVQRQSALLHTDGNLLPNAQFLAGATGWDATNLTAELDTSRRESGPHSLKLTSGSTATNVLKVTVAEDDDMTAYQGRWVTFTVRWSKDSDSVNVGRFNINDGVSVSTDKGFANAPENDGFVTTVVTKYVDPAADELTVGIYPAIGIAATPIWVQWASLVLGVEPRGVRATAPSTRELVPPGATPPRRMEHRGGVTQVPAVSDLVDRVYRVAATGPPATYDAWWTVWGTIASVGRAILFGRSTAATSNPGSETIEYWMKVKAAGAGDGVPELPLGIELPMRTNPGTPDSGPILYGYDNGGTIELRVKFQNGTVKTLTNHT